jgi:hypothetical protein
MSPRASRSTLGSGSARLDGRGAYLYWMTLGGPDERTHLDGRDYIGTLQGAAAACEHSNHGEPARTYRAAISVSAVPGDGDYVVSAIKGSNGAMPTAPRCWSSSRPRHPRQHDV